VPASHLPPISLPHLHNPFIARENKSPLLARRSNSPTPSLVGGLLRPSGVVLRLKSQVEVAIVSQRKHSCHTDNTTIRPRDPLSDINKPHRSAFSPQPLTSSPLACLQPQPYPVFGAEHCLSVFFSSLGGTRIPLHHEPQLPDSDHVCTSPPSRAPTAASTSSERPCGNPGQNTIHCE
jgi:hypothetical protein